MTRVLLLFVLLLGCSIESREPPVFYVARDTVLVLRATDLVDSDQVGTSIKWTLLKKPSPLANNPLIDKNNFQTGFIANMSGRYELAMSFGEGQSKALYRLTVLVGDTAADIIAQDDYVGPIRVPIALTVAGYEDLASDTLEFEWTVAQAPVSSSLLGQVLGGAELARAAFIADVVGTYRLELLATDSDGGSATSSFIVTATPFYRELPSPRDKPSLSRQGDTILYAAGRKLLLLKGDEESVEIPLAFEDLGDEIGDAELYLNGAMAVVLSENGARILVVDTEQRIVTQTILLSTQHRNLIGLGSDGRIFVRPWNGGLTAIDPVTGAVSSLLDQGEFGVVYDSEQNAFYSTKAPGLAKWEFVEGDLVQSKEVALDERPLDLHISSARRRLVDLTRGNIFSVSPNEGEDLVQTGSLGTRSIGKIVQPANEQWSVAIQPIPDNFGDLELVLYQGDASQQTGLPLAVQVGYDGQAQADVELLDLVDSSNSDELFVLLNVGSVRFLLTLSVLPE